MSTVSSAGSRRVSTSATAAAATPPTVKKGSKGPTVTTLQKKLAAAGFNPGPVDGIFGPKTQAAVLSFQKAKGLVQDGIVGPKTWGALNKTGGARPPAQQPGTKGSAETFVQKALAQRGDRYVFGAETKMSDKNPSKWDCSELVEWAAHQAGVKVPDGTMNQLPYFKQKGTTISVDEALRTRGALLYRPGHVAISLGDGRTIEARGSAYGVNIFSAHNRGWTAGALIPGLKYG
ncbi:MULTISPECIES: peptidoglycan-binding protein [Myxococcus]|uniref:peptidoglycan-binding protein n=1 Tax=Myxococcus TaxID=32 RepID=UPI001144B389|nr:MULTISPECIES: peptidoglycan-binding protein [Myxococcus]MCK8496861.1 peptidoglycan-binding protein [Myxococcus fulvus]